MAQRGVRARRRSPACSSVCDRRSLRVTFVHFAWFIVLFASVRKEGKFVTIADGWRRAELSMSDLDFARGLASERTRFREIVLASEAVGRERAAIELNTELSPDAARRTLRELAAATPGAAVVNIVDARRK